MKYTIEDLKKNINLLSYYERLADEKEQAYEADPMNADREDAFDRAYETEYNVYIMVLHIIQHITGCTLGQAQYIARRDNRSRVEVLLNQVKW